MLLLHLSDLHFGAHSRFKGEDLTRLGKAFYKDLAAAREGFAKSARVDLVVVTGDIAESGKPTEFKMGETFLAALAGELGLDPRRFVFVPGNHDVSWPACKKVEAEQDEEGFDEAELRRRLDEVKLGRYQEFLRGFYGVTDLDEVALPLRRGAYLYAFEDLRLSVAALNSCEKESHRRADHVGFLSREQAEALMSEWRAPEKLDWLKIVTVHHNPVVTTLANREAWRKEIQKKGLPPELADRYESDVVGFEGWQYLKAIVEDSHVQLVLHGHHHAKDEQSWDWRKGTKGRAAVLSAGSLTLEADKLPENEPLSLRWIELDTQEKETRGRSLIFDPRARTPGELRVGAFVSDASEPGGYLQQLDLPPGFEPAKTSKKGKAETLTTLADFLRSYRSSHSALFSRWELSPVGAALSGGAGKPIEAMLDDIYQPLRLAEGSSIAGVDLGAPISPDELLVRNRPIFIRGAAGVGKTTWMRWTFRRLLDNTRALPLILLVRDFTRYWQSPDYQGMTRSLGDFLNSCVNERMGDSWDGELNNALEMTDGPRPVLLVEGWDDAGELSKELQESLVRFMREYPRLLVVVASRSCNKEPFKGKDFESLTVQPLADKEVEDFVRRFFRQYHVGDALTAERESERFWSELRKATGLMALARTAEFLTIMLLIGRSRPLPDKRHLLMEACINDLLTTLPDLRAAEKAQWRPEDSEDRKRVAASLAFALQDEGYNSARRTIARSLEGMTTLLPSRWAKRDQIGFLTWLTGAVGLLAERADAALTFTDLMFQEYLAAWHLNANTEGFQDRFQEFRRQENPVWWETLRLWAALIENQNLDRLDSVLKSLTEGGDFAGLAFVGTIMAEGLGTSDRFAQWKELWISRISSAVIPEADICARSWAASGQKMRKHELAASLRRYATQGDWLAWIRLQDFLEDVSESRELPLPNSHLSRIMVQQLVGQPILSEGNIAAGRILCAGPPLWPVDEPLCVGLLQVWPGERRLAGLRCQHAIATGAQRSDIMATLSSVGKFSGIVRFARTFARDFPRYYVRDFDRNFDKFFDLYFDSYSRSYFKHNISRDLAYYFALYFAHYLNYDFAAEFDDDFDRNCARECAQVD